MKGLFEKTASPKTGLAGVVKVVRNFGTHLYSPNYWGLCWVNLF